MSLSIISDAFAATPTTIGGLGIHPETLQSILLLLGFIAIFYFLIWRPQSKRAQEHQNLVSSLQIGDEVVTSGGILGRITKITDNFVVFAISDNVEIFVQKNAIASTMPKGTMKSI